ncbi:quinohemoprotein amine dehydrogenase subunit beta [Pukyongiella litopenaei]|uniref:Quinohemoprotein amine dehydrogenase subunit beta n=1 Tax=Pukyongiella litopenaei TaxID=2605946 RepID=A0A2S0MKD8_9RHOB|nr:quinohemoprotein amine dehydrogenase subunit beta [Pukyongiella litopenaei]AVO36322.1 quinohemoprotein amine dehydrogenase subunit beta [Pukyongiella litopenaei]
MRKLLTAAALSAFAALPALAGDLLVTVARPSNLYVFDAEQRALKTDCNLASNPLPGIIAMSPDNSIAYVLVNNWQDVIGVDIETCDTVFHAAQSTEDVIRRSIASLAVSKDGSQLYTVRNPVRLHADRFEVLPAEFAVYDTGAGLSAEPVALHPAPRRSTLMATDRNGQVYIAGHDIFRVDPASGETETAIANASWDRPTYSPPDVLAFWPTGSQNDEFLLMYTAARFTDETQQEMADFVWGYETVDLTTGETEIADFASFEVLMFSAVRTPHDPKHLYAVYTQLSKHDLETQELVKRVDLPHTYYVINISSDGKEVYVGGTNDDIGIYDTETLERIGEIRMPSGGDMSVATLQVVPQG